MRLCVGANHAEGCAHEPLLRQGVERFLAHHRTHRALTLALAQDRPLHPDLWAERILRELARVSEQLDGCETEELT